MYDGSCGPCKDGYWGTDCYRTCGEDCPLNVCNKCNGSCGTCKDEYWGKYNFRYGSCFIEGGKGCSSNVCNKSDGSCIPCMGYGNVTVIALLNARYVQWTLGHVKWDTGVKVVR